MGSLFGIMGLPSGKPFLKAEPKPKPSTRPLVGIAWKGGLQRTHKSKRTLKLAQMRPILDIQGLDFISIQYGGEDIKREAEANGLRTPEDTEWETLTSWIAACDLVITVPQTAFHQAGGLGRPCIVLRPDEPGWQYAEKGPKSRWYESVRLFDKRDGWDNTIMALAADLRTSFT